MNRHPELGMELPTYSIEETAPKTVDPKPAAPPSLFGGEDLSKQSLEALVERHRQHMLP
jgi:hypothetical protein